jgi:signal transduction histidine kinase
MLLQIAEPGKSTAPHQHRLAVGIDLGTTNSLVATVRSSEAAIIEDEEGRALLPSVVRYLPKGGAQVGYEALAARATDCDLAELAREAIVARAPVAADKGVDFGLARAAPAHVRGDPASLAILMSNLIDNALRYTPPGGRVDVAVDDGMDPTFSVTDSGPGIAPEERERVFDRFYRGDVATEGGSGLGLSIVHRIVRDYDGEVQVTSKPGAGTSVLVRLPARTTVVAA